MPRRVTNSFHEFVVPRCGQCGHPQPQRRRFAFGVVIMTEDELEALVLKKLLNRPPPGGHWVVARADEGTSGYTPIFTEGLFDSEKDARVIAERLNKELGLGPVNASLIVLSTMRPKEMDLERHLAEAVHLLAEHVGFDKSAPDDVVEFVLDLQNEARAGLSEEDQKDLQKAKRRLKL